MGGDGLLTLLDFGVEKFFHFPAFGANQVVMVLAFVQLINGFATFKMAATQNAGLLELGQDPVNRGQTNVGVLQQQGSEDLLGAQMPLFAALKQLQNFESGQGGFQPGVFESIVF